MTEIVEDLAAGRRVLMDGGTGTEIERRGVPPVTEAWSSSGALEGPAVVREVHEAYLRAGARIIISNTFSTSRHALADAGLEEHFESLNRVGVELAREAVEGTGSSAVVAGGVTDWSWTRIHPPLEELQRSVEQQAKIMAAAGADLIVLEMMSETDRMSAVLEACQQSGLPVWVGFSATTGLLENETGEHPCPGTVRLLNGPTLAEGVAALEGRDVPVVSIMHTEVAEVDACLDVLDETWDGPTGVYAHSGRFEKPNWIFNDVISAEDYAAAARRWVDRGVQVIGGCCGIGPEHLDLLRPLVAG